MPILPRRIALGAALLMACARIPVAQAQQTSLLPPESVLRFQPRTAAEASSWFGLRRAPLDARPTLEHRASVPAAGANLLDGSWNELLPPPRRDALVAMDGARDRMLVFAGSAGRSASDAVFALDLASGGAWHRLQPSGSPPPTCAAAAVWDAAHSRWFVTGSCPEDTALRVFMLALTPSPRWSELAVTSGPGPRSRPALGYDPARDELLVHGGGADEVWRLSLGASPAWTRLLPPGPAPGERSGHQLLLDASRDRMLLVGGAASGPEPPVMALALGGSPAWSVLAPDPTSAADTPRAVLDPAGDELMLSDREGRTVALSLATPAWRTLVAVPEPTLRSDGFAMVLDAARGRLLRYGGNNGAPGGTRADAFELPLAGGEWAPFGPYWSGPRQWHEAVLDRSRGRMVVYGGWTSLPLDPLISLPLSGEGPWVRETPAPGPQPALRWAFSFVADDAHARAVLFGGQDIATGEILSDLWTLSFTSPPVWTRLEADGAAPGPHRWSAPWYDAANDRLLFFGGDDGAQYLEDCWEARIHGDRVTWRQLIGNGGLPFAYASPLMGDPLGHTVYTLQSLNALWSVALSDTPSFSVSYPGGYAAIPDLFSLMGYDSARHRIVGAPNIQRGVIIDYSTQWYLDTNTLAGWTQASATGPTPGPRYSQATVYDPVTDRFVIHGGYDDDTEYYSDTWALQYDRPTAVLASMLDATSDASGVRLAWHAEGVTAVTLESRRDDAPWAPVARLAADGRGRIAWSGPALAAGAHVAFRLALGANGAGPYSVETWLEGVAGRAEFALGGALRNPSANGLEVGFSLTGSEAARLELLDVSGRRLVSRDVSGLGAGSHTLRLTGAGSQPAGVYFVRLAEGSAQRAVRVVLLP